MLKIKIKEISAGTHSFDGKMVTEVVYESYLLKNGEYVRQQLQEEALKGIAKKALSPSNITKLPGQVKNIRQFVSYKHDHFRYAKPWTIRNGL